MPTVTLLMETSLDGDYAGDYLSGAIFYEVAAGYPADAVLFGSETARVGARAAPPEEEADRRPPEREDRLPYLVIPDSRGRLEGQLHVYRRLPYGRDVIVLLAEATPLTYRTYLKERGYRFIQAGSEQVDFPSAFVRMEQELAVKHIRCDGGGVLVDHLLRLGLADELVLILAPHIAGPGPTPLFRGLDREIPLVLSRMTRMEGGYVVLTYRVNAEPDSSGG